MSESKLKIQKDTKAQVIIHIDEARVVMDNCKVFANAEGDEQIVFQLQDPLAPKKRTVQITLTKVVKPLETTKKG